jgi:hypothetical protein
MLPERPSSASEWAIEVPNRPTRVTFTARMGSEVIDANHFMPAVVFGGIALVDHGLFWRMQPLSS